MDSLRRTWLHRLLVLLLGVGTTWLGIQAFLVQLHLEGPQSVGALGMTLELTPLDNVALGLLGAGMSVVLGVALVLLGFSGLHRPEKLFLLNGSGEAMQRGHGDIRISEQSLLKMLAWSGESIEGVSGVAPELQLGDSGWRVQCRVSMWHGAALNDVIEPLRKALRSALEHHTGLQVERIDLTVQHYPIKSTSRVA